MERNFSGASAAVGVVTTGLIVNNSISSKFRGGMIELSTVTFPKLSIYT